jgi:hypothetical protein
MVLIHRQSVVGYAEGPGDTLKLVDRRAHYALEVECPTCAVKPGGPCRQGDTFMPPLAVHKSRADAAL